MNDVFKPHGQLKFSKNNRQPCSTYKHRANEDFFHRINNEKNNIYSYFYFFNVQPPFIYLYYILIIIIITYCCFCSW